MAGKVTTTPEFLGSQGLNTEWAAVRAGILESLIAEHPNVDTMDKMLLERVSYVYCRIRQKESVGAFANERNYKSALSQLSSFMAEVRKADNRQELLDLIRADAIDIVVKSLKEAVHELPEPAQQQVMAKVIKLVHSDDDAAETG